VEVKVGGVGLGCVHTSRVPLGVKVNGGPGAWRSQVAVGDRGRQGGAGRGSALMV
jgi:hypothetical protein